MSDELGVIVDFENMLSVECGEFNIGEVGGLDLKTEDLDCYNPKQLNYWLRNRLMHNIRNYQLEDNKNGVVEFDITLHKLLINEKLFCMNRFFIGKCNNSSGPVNTLAVLVHDYPMKVEDHPLPHLLKLFYDSGNESLEYPLLPKVYEKGKHFLEYDQDFYSKHFEGKGSKYTCLQDLKDDARKNFDNKRIIEQFENLSSLEEFYKLRLVSLVKIEKPNRENTRVFLRQMVSGRFITIIGLNYMALQHEEFPNMDIPGCSFYGQMIHSTLSI